MSDNTSYLPTSAVPFQLSNAIMASKYPLMNWESPNLADTLKLFKQKMPLVCEDNEVTDSTKIARKIKIGLGDECLSRLNTSGLSEDDKKRPDMLWKFFEKQLHISVNFRIHCLALMQYRQKEGESLDDFVNHARSLAQQCNFTEENLQERLIELIIASTPMESYRRELLGKGEITLEDAINLGRQHEAAYHGSQQLESLYTPKPASDIHATRSYQKTRAGTVGTDMNTANAQHTTPNAISAVT